MKFYQGKRFLFRPGVTNSLLKLTTAKHLQTLEQGTNVKLPLFITPFSILLAQSQTPNLPLNHFSRPKDFQSPRNPIQQQEPILTSTNIIEYLQKNESDHSENLESEETESKQEKATENEEKIATAYIAKIPEFTGENNDTSPQKWLNKVQKAQDANGWNAARMLKAIPYFLQKTAGEWFENLEKPFENWQAFKDAFLQQFTDNNTSITLKNCFRNIKQETSETLKDKLIKKVCLHAPADLAAIRHAKNYEIAMEEANHTKLVNLAIEETSSAAEEKINQLTKKVESYFTNHNTTKTTLDHHPTTNLKIVTIVEFQDTGNKIARNYKETNKTGVINNNNNKINPNNQLVPQNSGQQRPNHYHTQLSYFIIPEESDFQQPIKPFQPHYSIQIAQNTNLSDIFPFEFEANELSFLLNNVAVNEQKAITAMYIEATIKGKSICLILNSASARNRPAQTVIVIADDIKKIPVGEINDFFFTINGITILVKVLIMDAPQY
ncbi:hypothetical protein G9A89_013237 [Geosiphon pyriformis]|nr:hypothetical protein G9A89_013237 [Geosiphon pyriformis]